MIALMEEIARNFTDEELRLVLGLDYVAKYGNHGFSGHCCPRCSSSANVLVSYIWSFDWTCRCGSFNICRQDAGIGSMWIGLVWEKPDIGPSKETLNRILTELGLHGRKY